MTAAIPVPNAIAIYEYVEGTGWSPKASVVALANNPTSLVRSCDGSLLLAYVKSGGGHRLARFVPGNATPTSDIMLANNATTRTLLRDSRGRILVFQNLGGGQATLLRVVP